MIAGLAGGLVARAVAKPWITLALALALTAASLVAAVARLGIDTDTGAMIARDLDWRQREIAQARLFPHKEGLILVVVDAGAVGASERVADALTAAIASRQDLFVEAWRPFAGAFFDRHGLLYLPPTELAGLLDRLIQAQPLLGGLARDPSLRGLAGALDLALEGVARGDAAIDDLAAGLAPIADGLTAAAAGAADPIDWDRLFLGGQAADGTRRLILARPIRDFARLASGGAATAFIRAEAARLGAAPGVVRLTGPVPLADEEFASVADGAGVGMAASVALVVGLLFLGLGGGRVVAAVTVTLIVGLVVTTGFAALAIGTLNMISVAFAVLFVGMGVDFGIQVATRFRAEGHDRPAAPAVVAVAAGRDIGPALSLAAVTTAIGFLAFLPTEFQGVRELGLIAGVGMGVAWALNLTLLPALLVLFRPPPAMAPPGWRTAGPLDRAIQRWRRPLRLLLAFATLAALVFATGLRFDADPLNLKDQTSESVATLRAVASAPELSTDRLEVLVEPAGAADLARRLAAPPSVGRVIWLADLVPADQPEKRDAIADAAGLLAPTLTRANRAPPPTATEIRAALGRLANRLAVLVGDRPEVTRLAAAVTALAGLDDARLTAAAERVTASLPARLARLATALDPGPVALADLPATLARDWIAADGRMLIEVRPARPLATTADRDRFIADVRKVADWAVGPPISLAESARVVVEAFVTSGVAAALGVVLVLWPVLRGWRPLALTLAPLLAAGVWTAGTMAALDLPLNFANVITLPLGLGVGVAFAIYFVLGHAQGERSPLASPTARAVVFSAATTAVSFGGLALSSHPGTAGMGLLLSIALGYALLATLLLLPVLLAESPSSER
jgi:hypothetical protein